MIAAHTKLGTIEVEAKLQMDPTFRAHAASPPPSTYRPGNGNRTPRGQKTMVCPGAPVKKEGYEVKNSGEVLLKLEEFIVHLV